MLSGHRHSGTYRHSEKYREFCLSSEHICNLCGLVHHLVHGHKAKGRHTYINDWSETGTGKAYGGSDKGRL